jgi:hypothetical protein
MFRTQEGGQRVVSMNARAVHPHVGVLRLSDDVGGAVLFTPSSTVHHLVFPHLRPMSVIRLVTSHVIGTCCHGIIETLVSLIVRYVD